LQPDAEGSTHAAPNAIRASARSANDGARSSEFGPDGEGTGSFVLGVTRGAISVVVLDLLAHLADIGANAGFERGRRELLLGLALATLGVRWRPSLLRPWVALACLLAPLACLHRFGMFALHLTGIAVIDVFLIALLPAWALLGSFARRRTSLAGFVLGLALGFAAAELLLLPFVGWSATVCAVALVWIVCETKSRAETTTRAAPRIGPSAGALLAGAWGVIAAALATSARPALFQHVTAAREGWTALVWMALIGLAVGAWFGTVLQRISPSRAWMILPAALVAISTWLCFQQLSLPGAASGLYVAGENAGSHVISWRALHQAWLLVGFPSVSLGALLCTCVPRGAWVAACVLGGASAGAWLGESWLMPRWFEPRAGASSPLLQLAARPVNATIDQAGWNPDGIAVRYRTLATLEAADLVHWQAQRWERDASWKRLEAAELLLPRRAAPNARSLWIVGHPGPAHASTLAGIDVQEKHVLDPLPSTDAGARARGVNPSSILALHTGSDAVVVLLAHAQQPASFSLRETSTFLHALEAELADTGGLLWVWCDPRALTAEGITRELAGWAAEFPSSRLYILQDGYAGPLFGLQIGGSGVLVPDKHADNEKNAKRGEHADDADSIDPILVLAAPVSECLANASARAPSLDWPALEWRAAERISPFTLPDGDVLAALAETLATPVSAPAGRLFRVLEMHARSQVDRPSFHTKWDHIHIEKQEIEAALALLRENPRFEPNARLAGSMAEVLFEKHDYDLVFDLLKVAVEVRPDVALFHHLLGRVRRELLDPDGAVAEYDLALALDPGSSTIKSELAYIHAEHGRWPIAVRLLEEVWAASTSPDPVIAKALGLGYLEVGRPAEARTLLDYAWQRSPGDGEIRQAFDRLDALKH
jgi:tetratricopeptide (TPR) repeat protein